MDWNKEVSELQKKGYTLKQIAMLVGVSSRSINSYKKNDTEPSWTIGNKILTLNGKKKDGRK